MDGICSLPRSVTLPNSSSYSVQELETPLDTKETIVLPPRTDGQTGHVVVEELKEKKTVEPERLETCVIRTRLNPKPKETDLVTGLERYRLKRNIKSSNYGRVCRISLEWGCRQPSFRVSASLLLVNLFSKKWFRLNKDIFQQRAS